MNAYFEYDRYRPNRYGLTEKTTVSEEETNLYSSLDQELRENKQFKEIAEIYGYDPETIGYLIERGGDEYWIRLTEQEGDLGRRYAPNLELRAILEKYYGCQKLVLEPLEPVLLPHGSLETTRSQSLHLPDYRDYYPSDNGNRDSSEHSGLVSDDDESNPESDVPGEVVRYPQALQSSELNENLRRTNHLLTELIARMGALGREQRATPLDPSDVLVMKQELTQLREEHDQLKASIAQNTETLERLRTQEREISNLSEKLHTTVAAHDEAVANKENLQKRLDESEKQLLALQAEKWRNDQRIAELEGQLRSANKQKVAFETQNSALRGQLVAMIAGLNTVSGEEDELRERLEEIQREWKDLENKVLAEKEAHASKIAELETKLAEQKKQHKGSAEDAETQGAIQKLEKRLELARDQAITETEEAENRIKLLEEHHEIEIRELQVKLLNAEQQSLHHMKRMGQLLYETATSVRIAQEECSQQLVQAAEENVQLVAKLQQAHAGKAQTMVMTNQLKAKIQDLEEELKGLQNQIEELSKKIEKLEQQTQHELEKLTQAMQASYRQAFHSEGIPSLLEIIQDLPTRVETLVSALHQRIAQLEKDAQDIQATLEEERRKSSTLDIKLQEEKAKCEEAKAEAEKRHQGLIERMSSAVEQESKMNAELENTQGHLHTATIRLAEIEQSLKTAEMRAEEAGRVKRTATESFGIRETQLLEQLKETHAEIERLKKALAGYQKAAQEAETHTDFPGRAGEEDMRKRIANLESELSTNNERLKELQAKLHQQHTLVEPMKQTVPTTAGAKAVEVAQELKLQDFQGDTTSVFRQLLSALPEKVKVNLREKCTQDTLLAKVKSAKLLDSEGAPIAFKNRKKTKSLTLVDETGTTTSYTEHHLINMVKDTKGNLAEILNDLPRTPRSRFLLKSELSQAMAGLHALEADKADELKSKTLACYVLSSYLPGEPKERATAAQEMLTALKNDPDQQLPAIMAHHFSTVPSSELVEELLYLDLLLQFKMKDFNEELPAIFSALTNSDLLSEDARQQCEVIKRDYESAATVHEQILQLQRLAQTFRDGFPKGQVIPASVNQKVIRIEEIVRSTMKDALFIEGLRPIIRTLMEELN